MAEHIKEQNVHNNNFIKNLKSEESKQKTKITALFFDLDNTLIPTRGGDTRACRKLSEVLENQFCFTKEEAINATQAFLKSFRRCPDNSQTSLDSWRTYLWREALASKYKHLAEQIYPKWLQLRYRYLALSAENVQLVRRAREVGFKLALITNGPSNAQWEKINKIGAAQYFDCVLVSSDLPWEKPNPNIFFAACNFLGVKPAECAMIGDKLESDIKGGRISNLGATFWIPLNQSETDLSDVEHPPDVILKSVIDLCKYFPVLGSTSMNSTSSSSISSATSSSSSATNSQRRSSQISFNTTSTTTATTSTCERDLYRNNQRHYPPMQHHHHLHHRQQRHKSAGSLSAIEYFNSDAENSSDSLFN